ncbi:hypothetical protein [Methanolacinia paynteri]|uniref:hypothetical protein n=1 Tax=Methanolacinia paynteri TaxID=230356 RepID=UPI00064E705D|nr:hypothetical protein [Methanolacinia paynteri]
MSDMNSDAKVRDLEHVLEEKEREIQMLRDSIHEYNERKPVGEERIKSIEKRINEIDGLMKGLMEEMLDVKACLQKISKSIDEDSANIPKRTPRESRRYPPVVSPSANAERKAAVAEAAAPPAPKEKKMIIQPDGTMQPEERSGEEMIVADHRNSGRSAGRRGDPKESKPLIYADDDDSIEIKRKSSR